MWFLLVFGRGRGAHEDKSTWSSQKSSCALPPKGEISNWNQQVQWGVIGTVLPEGQSITGGQNRCSGTTVSVCVSDRGGGSSGEAPGGQRIRSQPGGGGREEKAKNPWRREEHGQRAESAHQASWGHARWVQPKKTAWMKRQQQVLLEAYAGDTSQGALQNKRRFGHCREQRNAAEQLQTGEWYDQICVSERPFWLPWWRQFGAGQEWKQGDQLAIAAIQKKGKGSLVNTGANKSRDIREVKLSGFGQWVWRMRKGQQRKHSGLSYWTTDTRRWYDRLRERLIRGSALGRGWEDLLWVCWLWVAVEYLSS